MGVFVLSKPKYELAYYCRSYAIWVDHGVM